MLIIIFFFVFLHTSLLYRCVKKNKHLQSNFWSKLSKREFTIRLLAWIKFLSRSDYVQRSPFPVTPRGKRMMNTVQILIEPHSNTHDQYWVSNGTVTPKLTVSTIGQFSTRRQFLTGPWSTCHRMRFGFQRWPTVRYPASAERHILIYGPGTIAK